MKKSTIIILAVLAVVVIWGITGYNGLVKADEAVSTAWSNVENQYQRRADLIPNLVNTVKGYAAHEKETLDAVVAARARATQVTVDAESMTPEMLQEYQKSQSEVGAALGRLLAVAEAYPDLKAHAAIAEAIQQNSYLQKEITAARQLYNDSVMQWNADIFDWPTKQIVAARAGYTTRIPFTASAEIKSQARGTFF